jgi:hypothetical protein
MIRKVSGSPWPGAMSHPMTAEAGSGTVKAYGLHKRREPDSGKPGPVTYAFTQDVPADAAFYKRILEGLGPEPPEGLLVHLAIERPEGGLRYIDVWESQAACDHFTEARLHPVVHGLLAEVFGDALPQEPPRDPISVIHIWGENFPGV